MLPAEPLKVGYVVKRYPRFSETFIVNEILAHERAGYPVEIYALRAPVDTHFQEAISRVRASVHYLPEPSRAIDFWGVLEATAGVHPGLWAALAEARGESFRDVYQATLLARLVRQHGVGHLHAHFGTSATSVARLAAGFAGLSYTFTAHAKDIFHESVDPADLRRKLNDAASTITVSDYNLRYLRTHFGDAAIRVRRLYNGLDLTQFTYASPADRTSHIVAVGRLVEKKGFGDLVDACAVLKRRGRAFTCRIIGSGDLENALKARVARQGVSDRVALVGPRPQPDVVAEVRRAAVLAAPCVVGDDGNRDGLPTVLLEAMALGTPCVSTDVTGIPEVLRHDVTGMMVPQHHPEALADALERLLDDAEVRVRLAAAARRFMEKAFDVDRNAARMRALFAEAAVSGDSAAQAVPVPAGVN